MDIIRQRQPRRAQGATPAKPFQHKAKVRRNAHEVNSDQGIKASPWGHMEAIANKVDTDRVNWKGIIYLQQAAGVYNPAPRLVKHGKGV